MDITVILVLGVAVSGIVVWIVVTIVNYGHQSLPQSSLDNAPTRKQEQREIRVKPVIQTQHLVETREQSVIAPRSHAKSYRQEVWEHTTLGEFLSHLWKTRGGKRTSLVRRQPTQYTTGTRTTQQRPVVGRVQVTEVEEDTWDTSSLDDDEQYEEPDEGEEGEEQEIGDVVEVPVSVVAPRVVESVPTHVPQPTLPNQCINTQQLFGESGSSYKLDKLMDTEPDRYIEIIYGLIMKLYRHCKTGGSITRDSMVRSSSAVAKDGIPSVYTQKHWNHLIGGVALQDACVLRHAGIVVVKNGNTVLGYVDAEMACSRFYQWFVTEERGIKVISLVKETDEEQEREEDL